MIKLRINDTEINATEGSTILEAATTAGIWIPTMCDNPQSGHFASCLVCLVKEHSSGAFIPSCAVKVTEGMNIITEDKEIEQSRKIAIELLLSEHVGDCEAPCRIACPAFMDIPQMNRLIATGQIDKALEVVMHDIALPGVLGRICPAPCEGACRRKPIDGAVSICLLKRFVFDVSASKSTSKRIKNLDDISVGNIVMNGKRVAIIGAGAAGLSAAFYLVNRNIEAHVFDSNPEPGGELRYSIPDSELDKSVLDREIETIRESGAIFYQNVTIDAHAFGKLRDEFDAVIVASGNYSDKMNDWGLENNGKHIIVDKSTYSTNLKNVFAIGNSNRPVRLAIRSVAQGKEVVYSIEQMFKGEPITGELRRFNSRIGKLDKEEEAEYLKASVSDNVQRQLVEYGNGFDTKSAAVEASRCLNCDCRKPDSCKLRELAQRYGASQKRFSYSLRVPLRKNIENEFVIYEPGKCIKCGICVRITRMHSEELGLTYIGRGFNVQIDVPFGEKLDKALAKTAEIVAEACPTGALALKKHQKDEDHKL